MKHAWLSTLVAGVAILAAAPVLATTTEAYVPVQNEFASAVIMRAATGKVLYSFKPEKSHTAASLTKLVQAITMLDKNWNWNTVVTMKSSDEVGGGRLRVSAGATVKLGDLWQASLGSSANNAATAMSRVAGPGVSSFVKKMNAKVKTVGAKSTVLYDPSGMDARNQTTALDMAHIAKTAFSQPLVRQASQNESYRFALANGTQAREIKNTNAPLLDDPDLWLTGGKTGYLPESGYNYAGMLRPILADGSGEAKKEIVVVVFGAETKQGSFDSVKRLAEWAWDRPALFVEPPPVPVTLTLTYGMQHAEVRALQEFMSKDAEVYPEAQVTGKFGPLTLKAVQAFQRKHKIAKAGDRGYGVVGPATRAKIGELLPSE